METFLSVLILISSIVLIVAVAMTESDQAGLGSISGEQTSWGEHRGTTKRTMENRIITITSIVFVIALLALARF